MGAVQVMISNRYVLMINVYSSLQAIILLASIGNWEPRWVDALVLTVWTWVCQVSRRSMWTLRYNFSQPGQIHSAVLAVPSSAWSTAVLLVSLTATFQSRLQTHWVSAEVIQSHCQHSTWRYKPLCCWQIGWTGLQGLWVCHSHRLKTGKTLRRYLEVLLVYVPRRR